MPLTAGTRLGPYEILNVLGSGGMGDVYRARDTRLGRTVALKMIRAPEGGFGDLQRFELEARATSAIAHPNIVALYDVGDVEGAPFLVTELLQGETLRARLLHGPIPANKAIEYARQVASGLAAAHEQHIVHRDLKPENIFITHDGHVKILDFGLAKVRLDAQADAAGTHETTQALTGAGIILGTVAYLSPEQVHAGAVDHRSDLFAFGLVLFEMFTGRVAFDGVTSVDTMHAILNRAPEGFEDALRAMPPAVAFIVRQCLEKNPRERLQSARDLELHLAALHGSTSSAIPALETGRPRSAARWLVPVLAAAALVAAAGAGGYATARSYAPAAAPEYRQLTFRRGFVEGARFTGDGHTVVYSAAWEGAPLEVFSTRIEHPESRPLDLRPASVLAISPSGEIAAAINRHQTYGWVFLGTLARIPLVGGRPREVMEDVGHADWSPDGSALGAIRQHEGKFRLEYPLGKVLYETNGWLADLRVSHDGKSVAFTEHPSYGDDRGDICLIGADGRKRVLSSGWASAMGLAWSRRGDEIWFTASEVGPNTSLWAVTPAGAKRLLVKSLGRMTLLDTNADGGVLLAEGRIRLVMSHRSRLDAAEHVISWLDASVVSDISDDGTTVVFDEQGEGSRGEGYAVYMRKSDGSPAVRLGSGYGGALSPDGKSVAALTVGPPVGIVVLPTGAGDAVTIDRGPLVEVTAVDWLPDNKTLLISGRQGQERPRLFEQRIDGGPVKPISPEGFTFPLYSSAVSPDGRFAVVVDAEKQLSIASLSDGAIRLLPGGESGDVPLRWTADGSAIFVARTAELPVPLFRISIASGKRESIGSLTPIDAAGFIGMGHIQITPDGRQVAYTTGQYLADLYLAQGIR